MKNWVTRIVIVAIFAVLLFWPKETKAAELSLSLQQGIAEVGQNYGQPKEFVRQVLAGMSQAQPVIYPVNTKFHWVVDNEGWPRQTYQPGQIAGWEYIANLGGNRQIAFFYPADGSFFFAVVEKKMPITAKEKEIVRPKKENIEKPELQKYKQSGKNIIVD